MASVADKFQGLPIEELIAAPLRAACDAQRDLAHSAFEFMTKIGFEEGKDGKPGEARLLKFALERPVLDDPGATSKIEVRAPFIGLVPIPALLVDDVQIDFQMEVTDTATSKNSTAGEATSEASYKAFMGKAKINIGGKVTSSRENTRSTNQTAKYQVHVSARQQQPPEGLARLMDILASTVEPIPADKGA